MSALLDLHKEYYVEMTLGLFLGCVLSMSMFEGSSDSRQTLPTVRDSSMTSQIIRFNGTVPPLSIQTPASAPPQLRSPDNSSRGPQQHRVLRKSPSSSLTAADVQTHYCGEKLERAWSCRDHPQHCAFVYLGMVFEAKKALLADREATTHLWMALYSAQTVRRLHPDHPIVLITNVNHVRERFAQVSDEEYPFTDTVYDERPFIAKQLHFTTMHTRYARNLFLDGDTIIDGDLVPYFDVLQHYDLAMVPENGWHQGIGPMLYFQVLYNQANSMMPEYPGAAKTFPMWHHYEAQYNTGTIAFRGKSECTKKFFEVWHDIHIHTHCRKMDVVWDQCSLPLALRDYPIRIATMSEALNYRNAIGFVCTAQPLPPRPPRRPKQPKGAPAIPEPTPPSAVALSPLTRKGPPGHGIRIWHNRALEMKSYLAEKYGVSRGGRK